jgi:hypothetical protein
LLEQSQAVLPPLREEYAQIMRELKEEQAFVASIEQDDQDYLNELKTSISEQGYPFFASFAHLGALTKVI